MPGSIDGAVIPLESGEPAMKIMTIYAHPADTITNCGGTLALHADNGDEIVAVILTHGGRIHPNRYAEEWRKDHPDRSITEAGLAEVIENKKRELARAAEIVGIGTVVTLDLDDALTTVHDDAVEQVAQQIAAHAPDVIICDYPTNPVEADNTHIAATVTALAAIGRAGRYLRNLDGVAEIHVKQVYFTSLPVVASNALSLHGVRNDLFIDITDVVGRKIAAMDCFASQGYAGLFARKAIESKFGEFGRIAGVNFAEGFCRMYNETHALLPVTEAAMRQDPLTRHITYSQMDVRALFPFTPDARG